MKLRINEDVMSSAEGKIEDILDTLKEFEGTYESNTGWVGDLEVWDKGYSSYSDDTYVFDIVFGDDKDRCDEVFYKPNKSEIIFFPYVGDMIHIKPASVSALKRALKKEYSYLRRI